MRPQVLVRAARGLLICRPRGAGRKAPFIRSCVKELWVRLDHLTHRFQPLRPGVLCWCDGVDYHERDSSCQHERDIDAKISSRPNVEAQKKAASVGGMERDAVTTYNQDLGLSMPDEAERVGCSRSAIDAAVLGALDQDLVSIMAPLSEPEQPLQDFLRIQLVRELRANTLAQRELARAISLLPRT